MTVEMRRAYQKNNVDVISKLIQIRKTILQENNLFLLAFIQLSIGRIYATVNISLNLSITHSMWVNIWQIS